MNKFKESRLLGFVFLTSISFVGVRAGDLDPSQFLKEFTHATGQLEDQFGRVKGVCRLTHVSKNPKSREVSESAVFAADHGFQKVEITTEKNSSKQDGDRVERVYCFGRSSGFQLIRDAGSPAFAVKGIGTDPNDRRSYLQRFGRFLAAPYAILGTPLSQLLQIPTFKLISAKTIEIEGEQLVQMRYEIGEGPNPDRSMLILDPANSWAIRSGEIRPGISQGRASIQFEIKYEPGQSGTLWPRSVKFHDVTGETATCEFIAFTADPTPENEFRMTHYGLPDLTSGASQRDYLTLPILGLAFLVLFFSLAGWLIGRLWRRPGRV